jgi:uncharacterized protein with HEPN domain
MNVFTLLQYVKICLLMSLWNTIPWKNMAAMRDRILQDYVGVNYSIVRDVMKNKIPGIQKEISEFLFE